MTAQSCHKDMCSTISQQHCLIVCYRQNLEQCPSAEEWMRKMWYIYMMEYYTAEKNSDILNWQKNGQIIDLEIMIMSEVAQTQKNNYAINSLISVF